MKPLPIAEWLRSLDRMDVSLAGTLHELERHEAAVAGLLAVPEPPAALDTAARLLVKLDDRLDEHDRMLAVATEATTALDEWLTEQESAVARWQDAFTRWRGRIQQPASGPPAEPLPTS